MPVYLKTNRQTGQEVYSLTKYLFASGKIQKKDSFIEVKAEKEWEKAFLSVWTILYSGGEK